MNYCAPCCNKRVQRKLFIPQLELIAKSHRLLFQPSSLQFRCCPLRYPNEWGSYQHCIKWLSVNLSSLSSILWIWNETFTKCKYQSWSNADHCSTCRWWRQYKDMQVRKTRCFFECRIEEFYKTISKRTKLWAKDAASSIGTSMAIIDWQLFAFLSKQRSLSLPCGPGS